MKKEERPVASTVFVVSDGTGRTAEQAVNAAMTQFPGSNLEIIRRAPVRSTRKLREVIREAEQAGGFIVHTFVTDQLRGAMIRIGRQRNVETIDLMGPLLGRLSNRLAVSPREKPGLFSQLNRDYFRRIETMEFAIRHDDGQRIQEIRQAEIVLIGVSRTFKTPLSIFLSFKGWLVANVPVVPEIELAPIVFRVLPRKVFFLDTNPRQLMSLRHARHEQFQRRLEDYVDFEAVRMELMHARRIYHRNPKWHLIDVTNKPIEEIASEVLALLPSPRQRRKTEPKKR
jgi:regulator of PEP synthase PpsR (kinase-PPPase family)